MFQSLPESTCVSYSSAEGGCYKEVTERRRESLAIHWQWDRPSMCIPYKYDLVRDVTLQSESKLNMCLLLNRAGFLLSSSSQRQSETFEVFLACQLVTKRRLCHPLVLYEWYDMPKSRKSPAAAFKVFTAMEVKDRPAGKQVSRKKWETQ